MIFFMLPEIEDINLIFHHFFQSVFLLKNYYFMLSKTFETSSYPFSAPPCVPSGP